VKRKRDAPNAIFPDEKALGERRRRGWSTNGESQGHAPSAATTTLQSIRRSHDGLARASQSQLAHPGSGITRVLSRYMTYSTHYDKTPISNH